MVIAIRPSARWVASIAWRALTSRFRKTWLSWAGEPATGGTVAEVLLDGDPAAIQPAADHLEGRPDRLVDVGLVDRGAVEPGEAAEVLHDVGHPLDPLARAVEDLAHVLLDVVQVELVGEAVDLPDQLGPGGRQLGAGPARRGTGRRAGSATSRSRTARLLATYASGLLISWATPAESIPSEASFSDWTTRARIWCRSMNWPIWLPRLAIISRMAWSDRPDLAAEELEDAQAFAPEQDRHGEGRRAGRSSARRAAEEVGLAGDVRRSTRARRRPRRGPGSRTPRSRAISRVMASNRGSVQARPAARASRSAAAAACGSTLQNAPRSQSRLSQIVSRIFGRGLAGRVGLGQNAGRLVLRRQPPLGLLSPGDVVEDDDAALDRAALVAQRAAGDQDPGPVLAAGIGDVELGLVDRLAADGPDQRQILDGIERRPDRAGRSRNGATTPRVARRSGRGRGSAAAAGLKTRNRPVASATTTPSPMQSRTDWRIRVCSR